MWNYYSICCWRAQKQFRRVENTILFLLFVSLFWLWSSSMPLQSRRWAAFTRGEIQSHTSFDCTHKSYTRAHTKHQTLCMCAVFNYTWAFFFCSGRFFYEFLWRLPMPQQTPKLMVFLHVVSMGQTNSSHREPVPIDWAFHTTLQCTNRHCTIPCRSISARTMNDERVCAAELAMAFI